MSKAPATRPPRTMDDRARLGIESGPPATVYRNPPLRTWVELVVQGLQTGLVNVGVDLSGRDVGVSEHGLHGPQIGAVLQEMSGEAVAQDVRGKRRADAGFEAVRLDDAPE